MWCRADKIPYLREKIGIASEQYKNALGFESVQEIACRNRAKEDNKRKDDDGNDIPRNPYVALIAMDGDEMGKWVSGEKTPEFFKQLSKNARSYIMESGNIYSKLHRLLTPSYHIQFSEALSNFATLCATPVVKQFDGQLIYSGGDDVLAMVPADQAIDCAEALRNAFRGVIPKENEDIKSAHETPDGFIIGPAGYPIIVPGPTADVSIGIAVGHYKSPLQMLVRESQRAEKIAKNTYGRGALAVVLYKRSGEVIEWGCKWDTSNDDEEETKRVALKLLRRVTELSPTEDNHATPLSNRFPYALAQLLEPYALKDNHDGMQDIILKEFEHVLSRQGAGLLKKGKEKEAEDFRELVNDWLKQTKEKPEDFVKLFLVEAFINRRQGGGD